MNNSESQLHKYFEIAMSIGQSLDLSEMLQLSLPVFVEKLECKSVAVFNNYSQDSFNLIYSFSNNEYKFSEEELQVILKKHFSPLQQDNMVVPITAELYCHLLPIDSYGVFVLIHNRPIAYDELYTLEKITKKLSNAINACINNRYLQESEKRYRDLGELLPEMVCETDINGNVTFANKFAIEKMGYTYMDIEEGFHISRIFHSSELQRVMINLKSVIAGEQLSPRDYTVVTKGGEVFPVIVYTNCITENGEIKGVRGVMIDISERKRSEEKLKETAERLELALTGSKAGLWDWNIVTGHLYFSSQWCNMLGYEEEDIEGNLQAWKDLVHPEDIEIVMEVLESHLEGKTDLYRTEHRILTKSGNWKWVLDTGKVTERDKNGNAVRAVGTQIDINDKKQYEFILQKNLVQQEILSEIALELNSLENFTVQMNSVLERIGKHTNVSRVYIFEDSADGVTTSNTFEWCNTDIVPQKDELQEIPYEVIPSWKKILEDSGSVYSENISELPQDLRDILEPQEIKSIVVYPLYVRAKFFGFIGFDECVRYKNWEKTELELLRTISGIIANTYERKISEQSLIESELRTRTILDSIPDLIIQLDKEGTVLGYRDSSNKNREVSLEQYVNKNIYDFVSQDVSGKFKSAMKQCLTGGSFVFDYEYPVNDIMMDFEARMSRMNANEVIVIIRNVSERKEYERKLKLERDNAFLANKAKTEFLANMSHEIRTPMNAILGFSEGLYYKLENQEHKAMVKSILNSGNLLLALLNDILDLSKIESGKLEITPKIVDVADMVAETQLLFSDKIKQKNLSISVEIDELVPNALMLDEIRVKQVLFNLVGNAVKFTQKGFVRITVSFVPNENNEGNLFFRIIDTGIGISKSAQEKIFESFQQESGQLNRQYEGVGLGLAISRRLMEKMNGNISVDSELGKGSTFTLEFDNVKIVEKKKSMVQNSSSALLEKEFRPATLLVVDDVVINAEVVNTLLMQTKINVILTESGEEALSILQDTTPDVILLDLRMPGMDGFETAKRIRNTAGFENIPIVAFTASVFSPEKIEDSHLFNGYLYKPVNRSNLFSKLSEFIDYTKGTVVIPEETVDEEIFITDELIPNLAEIQHRLNIIYCNKWYNLKDSLVLFQIESFAHEIEEVASEYEFKYLADYAHKILIQIKTLDLEALPITIKYFEEIMTKIGSKQTKQ